MIPDILFIENSFTHFNSLIFNNKLPKPRFSLTRARTFRGKLRYRVAYRFGRRHHNDFEMRISTGFDLPQNEWEDVIIHEMIHLFILTKGIEDTSSHGKGFRKIMADINRLYGRNIVVSSRATEEQVEADKRIRGHFVCLAKFSDGRLGLAPVTKTRIFSLWDDFQKFPDVVSIKWIGTTDPWFNRFNRVMKPKLYIYNREEVALHLKGAVLLERTEKSIRVVNKRCCPDELLP